MAVSADWHSVRFISYSMHMRVVNKLGAAILKSLNVFEHVLRAVLDSQLF